MDCLTNSIENDPIFEFFKLELSNALNLIQIVHSALASLSRVCRGIQILTNSLQKLAENLLEGKTPSIWSVYWPEGPEELIPFLQNLVSKANSVQVIISKH